MNGYQQSVTLDASVERWFKAIAEARPELSEAVWMILETPLQGEVTQPLLLGTSVEQLIGNLASASEAENGTQSPPVVSVLSTTENLINSQGGLS